MQQGEIPYAETALAIYASTWRKNRGMYQFATGLDSYALLNRKGTPPIRYDELCSKRCVEQASGKAST